MLVITLRLVSVLTCWDAVAIRTAGLFVVFGALWEQRMEVQNDDSTGATEGVRTERVPAQALVQHDQIILPDGLVATVGPVALYSPGASIRDRKRPHCRIRVTIHGKSGSSHGSVTAGPGDYFDKLVGVEQR